MLKSKNSQTLGNNLSKFQVKSLNIGEMSIQAKCLITSTFLNLSLHGNYKKSLKTRKAFIYYSYLCAGHFWNLCHSLKFFFLSLQIFVSSAPEHFFLWDSCFSEVFPIEKKIVHKNSLKNELEKIKIRSILMQFWISGLKISVSLRLRDLSEAT